MERLVRILVLLAGAQDGVPDTTLLEVAEFGTDDAAARTQLLRELRHLRSLGYQIDNVAGQGAHARYRLLARDNRLELQLSPAQRTELARAAAIASRSGLAAQVGDRAAATAGESAVAVPDPPRHLAELLHAAKRRCLVDFSYNGRPRQVHPYAVHSGPSGWYLRARETDQPTVKQFVVSRMSGVHLQPPRTAEAAPAVVHAGFDPLSWEQDPPTEVELSTAPHHVAAVRQALPGVAEVGRDDWGVRLRLTVTNRQAFRGRLYGLGTRAHLLGPPDVRAEVLAELRAAGAVT